jgi:hypothetical protein
MNAAKFEIRKLTLGENLDEAFKLFRHGFWRFLFFQLLIYGPSIAVFAFAFLKGGDALLAMLESGEMPDLKDFVGPIFLLSGAMLFIYGIVAPISIVALTRGVADTYLSRRWTVGSILGDAVKAAPRAIVVGLVVTLVIVAGYFGPVVLLAGTVLATMRESILAANLGAIALLIISAAIGGMVSMVLGTYIVLRYSVALTAVAVEDASIDTALRRSATLVSGHYGTALGLFLIQIAFNMLAGFMLSALVPSPSFEGIDPEELKALVPQLVRSQILSSILGQVAGMLVGTYTVICWTLFYFTQRCEKEGFDLTYLADKVARGE